MIICHLETKPLSYCVNPMFKTTEKTEFDWELDISDRVIPGEALPYGLSIDWNVRHLDKESREVLIECSIRFRMDFEVESEAVDRKDLAGYLADTLSQVQGIIRVGISEHFVKLRPLEPDYEARAHAIMWDIIEFGGYGSRE